MGLLDKLTKEKSKLSKYNGVTPPINPLSTKQSKLHGNDFNESYSTDGINFNEVNAQFQSYDDGVLNALPKPSLIDIKKPITKYVDNPPEQGSHF